MTNIVLDVPWFFFLAATYSSTNYLLHHGLMLVSPFVLSCLLPTPSASVVRTCQNLVAHIWVKMQWATPPIFFVFQFVGTFLYCPLTIKGTGKETGAETLPHGNLHTQQDMGVDATSCYDALWNIVILSYYYMLTIILFELTTTNTQNDNFLVSFVDLWLD